MSCIKVKRDGWIYEKRPANTAPHGEWKRYFWYSVGVGPVSEAYMFQWLEKVKIVAEVSLGITNQQYRFRGEYGPEKVK